MESRFWQWTKQIHTPDVQLADEDCTAPTAPYYFRSEARLQLPEGDIAHATILRDSLIFYK